MLKKYKQTMIITSILLLLPILAGILLWNRLPDTLVTHWNSNWEPDGWTSKPLAVLGLPALLLGLHWLSVIVTSADPKKQHLLENKAFGLVLWIVPVISLMGCGFTLCYALEIPFPMQRLVPVLVGLLFVIIGNYLPKCRQSYTLGIKLPWTLADEENWRRTHRLAGPVWMIGGLLIMLSGCIKLYIPMIIVLALMVGIPFVYSYVLYTKSHK